MHHPTIVATLAALAALPCASAAGLYTKGSPVLQVDGRSYDKLIANSNYTSIVEFYAPWCGHCQNLKPAFEKAAKNLDGLAKVAAVNCDEESNKSLCGAMGVQGFPTLKLVRPSKKPNGKPVVEDYQGQRTASAITEAVVNGINNHVTRVTDKDLDTFLATDKPKALLFTDKGSTSALLRSIAIDFLDVVSVGQVRNKETAAVERFGVDKFPTLVLVPTEGEPIVYSGDMKKKEVLDFVKQLGEPNPDPAPAKKKADKKDDKKTEKKDDKKKAESAETTTSSAATEASEEATPDAESAQATPPAEPGSDIIPIDVLAEQIELIEKCLQPKSATCILALIPPQATKDAMDAVVALSTIKTKYIHGKRHTFPFFAVPAHLDGWIALRESLQLENEIEVIAINTRRNWWRRLEGEYTLEAVEAWIDNIRMGEGEKKKLPEGVIVGLPEPSASEEAPAAEESSATMATDPEPEVETEAPEAEEKHDEL
jgi:protein disulfide-isomerase A6